MNGNNPHKPLRSNWRNEAFSKPKKGGKTLITSRSIGRNNQGIVRSMGGVSMSHHKASPGSYLY